MTYDELKQSIPDANYFYANLTKDDIQSLTIELWWGQVNGLYYVGSLEEIPVLSAKEVKA